MMMMCYFHYSCVHTGSSLVMEVSSDSNLSLDFPRLTSTCLDSPVGWWPTSSIPQNPLSSPFRRPALTTLSVSTSETVSEHPKLLPSSLNTCTHCQCCIVYRCMSLKCHNRVVKFPHFRGFNLLYMDTRYYQTCNE